MKTKRIIAVAGCVTFAGAAFQTSAQTLEGRLRVETSRSVGGSIGNTVAIGSFANDGVGKHIRIHLKAHNGSVIDVHTYEISEVAYIGPGTAWLEVPLSQLSVSYTGVPAYAVDVYRQNIMSTADPLYVRVRVKRAIGAGTVQLVIDYDDDSTFTSLTATSTTATSFNSSSAPAGGGVTGYYGAAEWMFPVSNGLGWSSASDLGLFVRNSGNVGIGTTNPTQKLSVNGTIRAKEVIVEASPWPDDVFEEGYKLKALSEVAAHIAAEGHLPDVPSAAAVAEQGVAIGEMQKTLLRKIEELTLYVIRQEKAMQTLTQENAELRDRLERIEQAK